MWWLILLMSILAIGVLAFIWLHRRNNSADRKVLNIEIAKQQLADLKKQHASGKIDDVIFNQAYTELLLSLDEDIRQTKYQTDENSISKPGSRGVVLVVMSVFFLAAVPMLYYQIGDPLAVEQVSRQTVPNHQTQAIEGHNESYEVMAARLEARLASQPDDAKSWYLLGRTYMVMKNYPRAVLAMQKVYEMHPNDIEVLISYADAIAMLNDGRVVDKAMTLAQKAQQISTDEPTAAWLLAMGYEQRGNYEQAVQNWQRVVSQLSTDPLRQQEAKQRLEQARASLKQPLQVTRELPVSASTPATGSVTVVIDLAKNLTQQVTVDDTVFVFARAANGPRQPLAVYRLKAGSLPATITLDDSMAMSPMNKLSDHQQIYVSARISRSGNAMAQAGDLQGNSPLLELDKLTKPVNITINTQLK